jgi:predicted kinase
LKPFRKATIICGSPGAGKSTYGRSLANAQGAVFLDIDTCSEKLVMAGLNLAGKDPFDRDTPNFKEHFRDAIYDTLLDIASENLPHCDVVVVGPFTKEIRDADWPGKLKDRLKCRINIVYVYCNPKERKSRIKNRKNPRDAIKLADYEMINDYYGDEQPPEFKHSFIDTSQMVG